MECLDPYIVEGDILYSFTTAESTYSLVIIVLIFICEEYISKLGMLSI